MVNMNRVRCSISGSLLWPLILLASVTKQVSAFVPSSLARHRLDPATATAATTTTVAAVAAATTRHHHDDNINLGRRPRRMIALSAAASSFPSEDDAFEAEANGDSGGSHHRAPPAGAAGAPKAAAAAAAVEAPSYRRLYDSAMRLLESELTLEAYPIPDGLAGNSAVVGKGLREQTVKTSITAFRSAKFRQIRAALVETDGPTQVLNFVMFPHPSYDLPIFGADLVSLPGVHLVCIDLQPSHPSQERDEKTEAAMLAVQRRHLDGLPWGGDLPEAARKFFSPHCLWAKLDPTEAVEQKALDAMMDYLHEYLRQARESSPVEGDGPFQRIAAGHAGYSNYRRENDPARGMLTRFYGTEWTEAAIEGILFDFKEEQ
ncbi:unnamed protein product [Pylaiella littoralis]